MIKNISIQFHTISDRIHSTSTQLERIFLILELNSFSESLTI